MLLLLRHAQASDDVGDKRFGGWMPTALTLAGMKASREVAESLTYLSGTVKALYASDMVRAIQSAEEVAQALSMPLEPQDALRDWNVGIYTGKRIADAQSDIQDHIEHPLKPISEGESYQAFLDRCQPFLKKVIPQSDLFIAVTHRHVISVAVALAMNKGDYPDTKTLKNPDPVDPSGIVMIDSRWKVQYQSEKD